MWRLAAILLGVTLPIWGAHGQEAARAGTAGIAMRTGNHPGFGRVVFDFDRPAKYQLAREGDRVTLTFPGDPSIGPVSPAPRNVSALAGGIGQAEIVVADGARLRQTRIGNRVVIDVLDAASVQDPRPRPRPLPIPPIPPVLGAMKAMPATAPSPGQASGAALAAVAGPPVPPARPPPPVSEEPRSQVAPAPSAPDSSQAPVAATSPASHGEAAASVARIPETTLSAPQSAASAAGPQALAGRLLVPPPDVAGAAFALPFGPDVGVAALRRFDTALLVFDERRPIDLAALRDDPILGSARVQLLPAATLVRLRLPEGMELALSRPDARSWVVAVTPKPPGTRPISPSLERASLERASLERASLEQGGPAPGNAEGDGAGRIFLAGAAPGRVVALNDPDTGTTLLVGTQRLAGEGVVALRTAPKFILQPTWQGVAVQPLADSVGLRAIEKGFLLTGGVATGHADADRADKSFAEADALANAAAMTRRFDFPREPSDVLRRRMQSQVSESASAGPRARGPTRLAVAQTMLALGLGPEAQALVKFAAEDDPNLAEDPLAGGLQAVAALVAGRPREAVAIDDPRLTGSDEVALWRAVRQAMLKDGSPEAATGFAATLPLILAYPVGLRERLLPLALETMAQGGMAAAATQVLAERKDDPALALARALRLQALHEPEAALAAFDAAAASPDRRLSARAAVSGVELRLAEKKIDRKTAADALDRLLYAWRGGNQELVLRQRLAVLRAETGEWRPALALLRETESIFPERKPEIRAALRKLFSGLLHDGAADALSPLDLIALVDENADLVSDAAANVGLQVSLAEKLVALDLPRRAEPVLEKLMRGTAPGAARARFGTSLAGLRLREGDAKGALSALFASSAPDMPPALAERRLLMFADASARDGDVGKALEALATVKAPAADLARATILERTRDWPAATQALSNYVAALLPAEGALTEDQQRLLVRLASDASQAADQGTLDELRTRSGGRMAGGPLGDMFRLLTAEPVRGVGDLKRARQEIALARSLPAGLQGLGASSRPAASQSPAAR